MHKKRTAENHQDNEFQPLAKCTKYTSSASFGQIRSDSTVIILIDFVQEKCSEQLNWLREKFALPTKFWKDMSRDYDYIPIEYSKSFTFLSKFFTTHDYFTYNYALSPEIQRAISKLFRNSPAVDQLQITDEIGFDRMFEDTPIKPKTNNSLIKKCIRRLDALQLVCRSALNYFSLPKQFTFDADVVKELIRQYPKAIRYVPIEFFIEENRNLILQIMQDYTHHLIGNKPFFDKILSGFSNDREIMYVACVLDPSLVQNISSKLRFSGRFMRRLILDNPQAFKFAPKFIRRDVEVIKYVIGKDLRLFEYVHWRAKISSEIVSSLVPINGLILKYYQSHSHIINNFDIITMAIKNQPRAIEYASEEIQTNLELVKELVLTNVAVLRFVHPSLINDHYFVNLASEKGFFWRFSQQDYHSRSRQLFGGETMKYLDDTELINKMALDGPLPSSWYSQNDIRNKIKSSTLKVREETNNKL